MRHVFLASCAVLAMAGSAQAATAASTPITIDTSWDVSLDANGRVTAVAQHGQVKALLADPLATAIRGWVFEPGHVNGRPAPTQTTLSLSVALESHTNDGYSVRVVSANTGGRVDKMPTGAMFSDRMLSRSSGFSGLVVLKIHYDQSGRVVSAESAPDAPKVQRSLSRMAIRGVQEWTFQPERVGGHGIASTVYLPICFNKASSSRAPDDGCGEWTAKGASSSIADGAAFALEPAATLKSDVIGRIL